MKNFDGNLMAQLLALRKKSLSGGATTEDFRKLRSLEAQFQAWRSDPINSGISYRDLLKRNVSL